MYWINININININMNNINNIPALSDGQFPSKEWVEVLRPGGSILVSIRWLGMGWDGHEGGGGWPQVWRRKESRG